MFPGTFGNTTGLQEAANCAPCLAGWYCPSTGLNLPFQACQAGYWCIGGSIISNPENESYGIKCPKGTYCPKGTPSPINCPLGTYQPNHGMSELSNCLCL